MATPALPLSLVSRTDLPYRQPPDNPFPARSRYPRFMVVNNEPEPERDWIRHSIRINALIGHEVRSLRKRAVVGSLEARLRTGAYWGIRTNIADYGAAAALPCPVDRTVALADIETRLARMEPEVQQRLINWGYPVCDAAVRSYFLPGLPRPAEFPRPGGHRLSGHARRTGLGDREAAFKNVSREFKGALLRPYGLALKHMIWAHNTVTTRGT